MHIITANHYLVHSIMLHVLHCTKCSPCMQTLMQNHPRNYDACDYKRI